jgi:uncharacterized membrane protein
MVKLASESMPGSDKYEFFLLKREKKLSPEKEDENLANNVTTNPGETTKDQIQSSYRRLGTAELQMSLFEIVRKTYSTLLVIFLTSAVLFSCFPSVLYLHFTQLHHYQQVIASYGNDQEAARNFLTIYAFALLYLAVCIGRMVSPFINDMLLDYVLSPVLIFGRAAIAWSMYRNLIDDKSIEHLSFTIER